jgi:hypothetical protein
MADPYDFMMLVAFPNTLNSGEQLHGVIVN